MHRSPVLTAVAAVLLSAPACRPEPGEPAAPTATAPTPARSDQPTARPSPARDSKPAEASQPAGDPETGRFAGITAAHNRVRARLDIAPLAWSPELARFAQAWADKLARKGCRLQHRPPTGADKQRYGENIFSMSGDSPSADAVVDEWAAEVKNYDPKTHRCKGVCGHYTQVVWRKSLRVGCGMATCGATEVWVCNYDPAGNWDGERPY